jgi:hypothetical protein
MATNSSLLQRPSDRGIFLTAAIGFPLLVFIAYFRSYYFRPFFDPKPLTNALVHAHGVVMTLWVAYFAAQIALVRTKNVRLHMTTGLAGIVLAALVVVVGLVTAYDSHVVRLTAPPGVNPHGFMFIAVADMIMFVLFFGGAIFFRKRPAEHKALMLMTAINFLPPAAVRLQFVPEKYIILWAYGIPDLIAIGALIWYTVKHRRLNKIFAAAVLLLIASQPLRIIFAGSKIWLDFIGWLVG